MNKIILQNQMNSNECPKEAKRLYKNVFLKPVYRFCIINKTWEKKR